MWTTWSKVLVDGPTPDFFLTALEISPAWPGACTVGQFLTARAGKIIILEDPFAIRVVFGVHHGESIDDAMLTVKTIVLVYYQFIVAGYKDLAV